MKACEKCGSYAINPGRHGRDNTDQGLCDVCFWRKRAAEKERSLAETQRQIIEAAERRGYARAEAENVGYRTDAGRYRFIRPGDKDVWCSSGDDLLTGDQLDAAIDAARVAKGADHG